MAGGVVIACPMILICTMKKTQGQRYVAPELSDSELKNLLVEIGKTVQTTRESKTTQERFVIEADVSKASIWKCESGRDLSLGTFLKIIYGLKIQPEDFFKGIRFKDFKRHFPV
jgi:DNA-binding XRE family transcriptional regulator